MHIYKWFTLYANPVGSIMERPGETLSILLFHTLCLYSILLQVQITCAGLISNLPFLFIGSLIISYVLFSISLYSYLYLWLTHAYWCAAMTFSMTILIKAYIIYVCMYVLMYTIYVCMYVCTYVCTLYVHIYLSINLSIYRSILSVCLYLALNIMYTH